MAEQAKDMTDDELTIDLYKKGHPIKQAILVALVVCYLGGTQLSVFAQSAVETRLDQQFALMNQQTPIAIDAITKLTRVARSGILVTYTYEIAIAASRWNEESRKFAMQRVIKGNCTDSQNTRALLDAGYNLRHVFFDQDGLFAYNVLVTKDRCP